MKKLLEDLEILGNVMSPVDLEKFTEAYNRLHNFLTKLAEVDLEEVEKFGRQYSRVLSGSDGKAFTMFLKVEPEFKNLIDILVDTPTLTKVTDEQRAIALDTIDKIVKSNGNPVTTRMTYDEAMEVLSVDNVVVPTKSAKEMFEELDLHLVKENDHYIKYQLYTSEMLRATDCNSFNLIFQKKKGYYYVKDYDMQVHFTKELHQAITQQLKEIE